MMIADILTREAVLPALTAKTRDAVLAELAAPLVSLHPALGGFDLVKALCDREKMGSTAVGNGVAIPHGKVPYLETVELAVGRSHSGIPFGAPDNCPCHIFFLILAPEHGAGQHLRLLAQIARRAKDPVFRSSMLLAETPELLWRTIAAP